MNTQEFDKDVSRKLKPLQKGFDKGIKKVSRALNEVQRNIPRSGHTTKSVQEGLKRRVKVPKLPSRFNKRMNVRFAPPTENSSYLHGNYLNNPSDKPMLGWK